MRRLLAAATLIAVLGVSSAALARPIVQTSDIPLAHPDIQTLWLHEIAPTFRRTPWIARFEGVTTPIQSIDMDGHAMAFGTSCKPHDCGANMVRVLFDPAGGRIVAHLRLTGRAARWIGAPNARERACLLADHDGSHRQPDRC
jgi:hypothetical protein